MTGSHSSNTCKGNSAFTFDAHMSGHASVDARGAHTGNNNCHQSAHSTGGSGTLGVTVPALLNLQSGTITINPTMTGYSAFNGQGPMVTGNHNHFGLQNLGAAGDIRDGLEDMVKTPDWAFALQNLETAGQEAGEVGLGMVMAMAAM